MKQPKGTMEEFVDRTEIQGFIAARKELVWYVKDPRALDDAAIVEAVLNYGNWSEVQELIRILGIEHVAAVFRTHAFRKRCNYHKKTKHYFNLYFNRYADAQ